MSSRSSKNNVFEIGRVVEVPLQEATRTRFLNYAVSVITSRALPDVRDGLKPVQRRILYTMHHDLHLSPEKSTLKCAKVVGQVLGNYHPHGDSAVYEAMARMAQPWVMRYPLVFGQGNFGSVDGDGPAAYRYTEAKLLPMAMEFVSELQQDTVDFRPNFDESLMEPTVLPARLPQLLLNGCSGIAVGIATNIPPHNLGEVMAACQALIRDRALTNGQLMKYIKGPDFPTGGEILDSRAAIAEVYEQGKGPIRVRGTYQIEEEPRRGPRLVIDSIPYMVNKASLVEEIGEIVMAGRIPQIQDVRDESTDDTRIVVECQKGSDPDTIMAYLYRHTSMQSVFHVNLTCLTLRGPERVDLRTALLDFVDFRFEVTVRRLRHEVRLLSERIHILEGFVRVFDDIDEAIRIIRDSDGRKQACERLQQRFDLDELQANAVLDLRLYKLARTDILLIREELEEKMARREQLLQLLDSQDGLWQLVAEDMAKASAELSDARRTKVLASGAEELSYQDEDFIVEEEVQVVLTKDGWVRRVSLGTDISKLRLRQEDEITNVLCGSTLASLIFFSSQGTAYTMRVNDLSSAKGGFGDPVQKYFKFADGERVVAAYVCDPRNSEAWCSPDAETLPPMQGLAVADDGKGLRFSFANYLEPSTKSGRRYARCSPGSSIAVVEVVRGSETALVVSRNGRVIAFPVSEVSFLSGAGRGVMLLKLDADDRCLDAMAVADERAGMTVVREEGGRVIHLTPKRLRVVARGGRGTLLIKRGHLKIQDKYYTASSAAGADESGEELSEL